jgi:hypothetical protein
MPAQHRFILERRIADLQSTLHVVAKRPFVHRRAPFCCDTKSMNNQDLHFARSHAMNRAFYSNLSPGFTRAHALPHAAAQALTRHFIRLWRSPRYPPLAT